MAFWTILQSLVLLAVANTAPLVAKKILGAQLSRPLDGGATFFDGRPVFGSSKTIRGVAVSIIATTVAAPIIGVVPEIGALMAMVAMGGDLLSSFIKRRLARPPSSKFVGLDQVPESLLPLLAVQQALSLGVIDIALAVALFFVGEIFLARLFYRLGLREQPY